MIKCNPAIWRLGASLVHIQIGLFQRDRHAYLRLYICHVSAPLIIKNIYCFIRDSWRPAESGHTYCTDKHINQGFIYFFIFYIFMYIYKCASTVNNANFISIGNTKAFYFIGCSLAAYLIWQRETKFVNTWHAVRVLIHLKFEFNDIYEAVSWCIKAFLPIFSGFILVGENVRI